MKKLSLESCRIKNFKAIRDSGRIEFTPLTVFIGNNGSGKSSVIKALETMRHVVISGLDSAMQRWHGLEYIMNQAVSHPRKSSSNDLKNPIFFEIRGESSGISSYHVQMTINGTVGMHRIFIERELFTAKPSNKHKLLQLIGKEDLSKMLKQNLFTASNYFKIERDSNGNLISNSNEILPIQIRNGFSIDDGDSIIRSLKHHNIPDWQFISLDPQIMGEPIQQQLTKSNVRLAKNGRNIAEYLIELRDYDPSVIKDILKTLQFILPYADDIQPHNISELERIAYLQLVEQGVAGKLPGWVLSTGSSESSRYWPCYGDHHHHR